MISNEIEDDWQEDPFFKASAEDTGMGASSLLAPFTLDEGAEASSVVGADYAWLERRARLTRLVTRTVGALGVFALVAPLAHAVRVRGATDAPAFSPLAEPVVVVAGATVTPPPSAPTPISNDEAPSAAPSSAVPAASSMPAPVLLTLPQSPRPSLPTIGGQRANEARSPAALAAKPAPAAKPALAAKPVKRSAASIARFPDLS
jgi:hypothetical protein